MGSVTEAGQVDLDVALAGRNAKYEVNHADEAKSRSGIERPEIHKSKLLHCRG